MNERHRRLGELFDAALERPAGERASFIAGAAGADADLRVELERMLAAHERAGGPLDRALPSEARPRTIGRYEILGELGRGGMGIVYRARDPRLGRLLALKLVRGADAAGGELRARLFAEARAVASLDHPHVCTVFDVGETEDGRPYFAMAYYEGRTLAQRLAEEGPLPEGEVLRIGAAVADALAAAHGAGVVHRDVKPSNLLLTEAGVVKVLDFGVAKLTENAGRTEPGTLLGTVGYVAPEQAGGGEIDGRADLWSLGVVLWELVSGKRPFDRGNPMATLRALLHEDPPPLERASPAFESHLLRLLAKRPEDRPASALEVRDALRALAGAGASAFAPLPAPPNSFVGRELECARIAALLGRVRLATLTGPAGTGKTRLAIEAARRTGLPAAFVPLAPLEDAALVPEAIVRALGAPEGGAAVERAARAIGERRALLVLDNFEHVLAGAGVVASLLERCPRLAVLATSRVALRLVGEHELPIAPLAVAGEDGEPAAVRLFLDRCRAIAPGRKLDGEALAAVAELCERLDGLPLAIELAAARSRLFGPRALLSRIGQRLDLLRGDERDRPARHQTLREAIAWSSALLGEEERALFRRLAAFVADFELEGALELARATGLEADAERCVEALVEHNLLRRSAEESDEPLFGMLETIHDYALEELERAGERAAAERAHGEHLARLADAAAGALVGPEQGRWLARLARVHDDARAALSRAVERGDAGTALRIAAGFWRYWLARGHIDEVLELVGRALLLDGGRGSDLRSRVLIATSTLAYNVGEFARARDLVEEALACERERGSSACLADALNGLAWIHIEMTELDAAEPLAREALEHARRLGALRAEAVAHNNLGWIATYRGDARAACHHHAEGLAIRERLGDERGACFARANLAWASMLAGELDRAEALLDEAEACAARIRDSIYQAWILVQRAQLLLARGELERLERELHEGHALIDACSNPTVAPFARQILAEAALRRGRPERAVAAADAAHATAVRLGSRWSTARSLYLRGSARLALGELATARADLEEALELRERIGDARAIAETRAALGRAT